MINRMSLAFRDLSVHAFGRQTDYQRTISNFPSASFKVFAAWISSKPGLRIDILEALDGIVSSGEMLLVLGRPGSGCTTLLKTLTGQRHDLYVDENSSLNYQGIISMS
jgi:ATP-binding cassette subfamily G (WHITE) protein 2 (PDR)